MSNSVMHAIEMAKRQEMREQLSKVTEERDRFHKALLFYANGAWPVNQNGVGGGCLRSNQTGPPDYGDVARTALQEAGDE